MPQSFYEPLCSWLIIKNSVRRVDPSGQEPRSQEKRKYHRAQKKEFFSRILHTMSSPEKNLKARSHAFDRATNCKPRRLGMTGPWGILFIKRINYRDSLSGGIRVLFLVRASLLQGHRNSQDIRDSLSLRRL